MLRTIFTLTLSLCEFVAFSGRVRPASKEAILYMDYVIAVSVRLATWWRRIPPSCTMAATGSHVEVSMGSLAGRGDC